MRIGLNFVSQREGSMAENDSVVQQPAATSKWRYLVHVLVIALLGSVASAILYKPAKTNDAYLQELIDTRTVTALSAKLVAQMRAAPENKDFTDSDWNKIEKGLAECMLKHATEYATSNDPYLNARSNRETPTILASRFLKACGAID
jgi:hypothetical protein